MKAVHVKSLIICALTSLAVLSGLVASIASAGQVVSPSSYKDDRESVIASDGERLWLATLGHDRKGKVRSEVREKRGNRWVRLGPNTPAGTGFDLHLALLPGKKIMPCLGDVTPKDEPRIRCHRNGRWIAKRYPKKLRKSFLRGLRVNNGQLEAFFSRTSNRGTKTTVTRLRFGRSDSKTVGPSLHLKGSWIAAPTSDTGSGRVPLRLDLKEGLSGDRRIATLSGKKWKLSKVLPGDKEGGTWGSPSVTSGNSAVSIFSEETYSEHYAGRQEWAMRFSLRRLDQSGWHPVGGGPLDSGVGIAQGGVFPVGPRTWAVWMEHNSEGVGFGGMFSTRYRAARLNRSLTDIDRRLELWTGETSFPNSIHVVEHRGGPVFLYHRQKTPRGGMHATVDFRFQKSRD